MGVVIKRYCLRLYIPNTDYQLLIIDDKSKVIGFQKCEESNRLRIDNYNYFFLNDSNFKEEIIYFDPLLPESFQNEASIRFSLIFNQYLNRVFGKNSILQSSVIYSNPILLNQVKNIPKQSVVLDIGCGNCFNENIFNSSLLFYFSDIVDYSRNSSNFIISNGYSINCPDRYYDFIWAFYVLEHVPRPDRMIDELFNKVKVNGEVWIIIPVLVSTFSNIENLFIPIFHLQVFTSNVDKYGTSISKIVNLIEGKAKIIQLEYFDNGKTEFETKQLFLRCLKV